MLRSKTINNKMCQLQSNIQLLYGAELVFPQCTIYVMLCYKPFMFSQITRYVMRSSDPIVKRSKHKDKNHELRKQGNAGRTMTDCTPSSQLKPCQEELRDGGAYGQVHARHPFVTKAPCFSIPIGKTFNNRMACMSGENPII